MQSCGRGVGKDRQADGLWAPTGSVTGEEDPKDGPSLGVGHRPLPINLFIDKPKDFPVAKVLSGVFKSHRRMTVIQ